MHTYTHTGKLFNYEKKRKFFHRKNKKQSYDQPRQHIIKQRHCFANTGPSRQGYGFFQWSCMDVRVVNQS